MKLKNVFQRKETKYVLSQEDSHKFFHDLQKEMSVDEYGQHTTSYPSILIPMIFA